MKLFAVPVGQVDFDTVAVRNIDVGNFSIDHRPSIETLPSLRPKRNPKTEKLLRKFGADEVEDKQEACSTRASGAEKRELVDI